MKRSSAILALILVCGLAPVAHAITLDTEWTRSAASGPGAWTDGSNWSAGVPGSGNVARIDNGGTAQVTNGSPSAGPFTVGDTPSGSGSLEVFWPGSGNPGNLTLADLVVGRSAGSQGSVVVDGITPTNSTSALYVSSGGALVVGDAGGGEFRSTNGGFAMAPTITVGKEPGSHGTVRVQGGGAKLWAGPDPVTIGEGGVGEYHVADGASPRNWTSALNIAALPGSTGTLTVSHSVGDTLWTSYTAAGGRVVVGGYFDEIAGAPVAGGTGQLTITNNPALSESHAGIHCLEAGGPGDMWVMSGGSVRLEHGAGINISGPNPPMADPGWLYNYGVVEGQGRISGRVLNHGLVSPGMSTGQLDAVYGYQQFSDGRLRIEIGGYNAGAAIDGFDVLAVVAGQGAVLDGELLLELAGGFLPNIGDQFAFLKTEGGVTGWQDVDITLVNFPPNLGATLGTMNDDLWLYAEIIGREPQEEVIPEPTSLTLLALGGLGLLARRRKR